MCINQDNFLRAVKVRAARIAVSASATRNQGPGTVQAARKFFSDLDLDQFSVARAPAFRCRLDDETKKLCRRLPKRSRSWGLARKLTNIFLRDAFYTTYLCKKFDLTAAENFFEIPLDSITAKCLRRIAGRGKLPRWQGVRHLTPEVSERYQDFARKVAEDAGIATVHLDTFMWGERPE